MHVPAVFDEPDGRRFEESVQAQVVAHVESARVVLWNAAAERLFGYPRKEAVGMPIELLVPGDIRPYHNAGFSRFRETDMARTLLQDEPSRLAILTKSGMVLDVYATLSRLPSTVEGGRLLLASFAPPADPGPASFSRIQSTRC